MSQHIKMGINICSIFGMAGMIGGGYQVNKKPKPPNPLSKYPACFILQTHDPQPQSWKRIVIPPFNQFRESRHLLWYIFYHSCINGGKINNIFKSE